jgi:hypothetical protein
MTDKRGDIGTASMLGAFTDQAQRRTWFLLESMRRTR